MRVIDESSIGVCRALPGTLFPTVAGLILALLSGGTTASTLEVNPTLGEVAAGKTAATFELRNPAEEPATFEARPFSWSQDGTGDKLSPATDVVIVPPLFTVQPGGHQLVRIAPRERPPDHELAYRVVFQEVPAPPAPGFVGVRTLLEVSVPLLFDVKNGREALEWHASLTDGGNLRLSVTNRGSRFAHFGGMEVRDGARVVGQVKGPQYMLAGAARTWEVGGAGELQRGARVTLILKSGLVRKEIPLSLE